VGELAELKDVLYL